jgi:hypothetical protein
MNTMKPFLLAWFCVILRAQEPSPAARPEEPKRPRETLALIDQARSLPPEFSADVLLKLAGSRFIPDAKWGGAGSREWR